MDGFAWRGREGGHGGFVGHDDDGAEVGDRGEQGFDEGGEGWVGAEDDAAGVVEDVGDVGGGEAWVHGVDDAAHAGDGVVQLEVALAVPGEGGDAVAGLDAEGLEGAGEAAGAALDVAVGLRG